MLPRRAVLLYYCFSLYSTFLLIQLTKGSRLPIKSGNFRRYGWIVKDSSALAERPIIFETGDELNAKSYSRVSFKPPSNSIETEDNSQAEDEPQLDTDSIRFHPWQKPLQAEKDQHRRRFPSKSEITNRGGASHDFLKEESEPAPSRDDISFNGSEDELFSAFFAHVKTSTPASTASPSALRPMMLAPESLSSGDQIADRSSMEFQSNSVESKKFDDGLSFLTLDSGIKGRSCESGHVFKHGRCRSKVSLKADEDSD